MDFDDLQALLWAHEHGSLQRASRASGVSRATLRRRLERLDAAVGRPTHVASPEGITLTAAGHALVEDGAELLTARRRMLDRARGAQSPRDTLRLLVQAGLPPRAISAALSMGLPLMPRVRLEIDFATDPSTRLQERFDAVVHWGEAPVLRAGFTRVVFRVPFCLMASPAYLAEHGPPQTLDDLAGHALLHLGGTEPRWPCLDGTSVDITPAHTCADLYVLGSMVAHGLGIALLPAGGFLVDDGIDALVPVLADHIRVDRALRLDMPVPSEPDSAASVVIQVLASIGEALAEIHGGT